MSREPLFGMTPDQELQFLELCDRFRRLGYIVRSEPLENLQEQWLAGLRKNLSRIEDRLDDIHKAYRTRGRSKAALYFLTSCEWFDPGFGVHVSTDQRQANQKYKQRLDRAAARFDAAFGIERGENGHD